jgi:branched-chain amino acid transport system permease protein
VIDMLNRLLSGDLPRSRVLAVLLLLIFLGLAAAPFVFPGVKALNVAAKVLIFVVLVASFDLLLGYTGIVSFAHTMFFGIGAYGVAIASSRMGAGWGALALGLGAALLVSLLLSLAIGLFSLRVRAIFFAMITLAVAAAFQTLASQLSDWTGGEDGLSFKLPEWLSPSFEPFDNEVLGVLIDGRIFTTTCCSCWPWGWCWRCCASSIPRSAACCRPSARTSSVPKPSATAWWCTARCPACCRPCSPAWPGRCWRCGCAITGPIPRCPSRS